MLQTPDKQCLPSLVNTASVALLTMQETAAAASDSSAVQQLQQDNQQLRQQVDSHAAALETLAKARDEARLQLADTQRQLEQERTAAGSAKTAAGILESRVADLQAEVRHAHDTSRSKSKSA